MPALGLDYAGGVPSAAAIKNAGYSFVVRYLTTGGPGLPGKLLTRHEFAALQAAGVGVVLNWETSADRMRGGWEAGVSDAQTAAGIVAGLGVPDHRPIYFSADWDASETEQQCIDDYLRGAATVLGAGRVGVYGSYYVVKRALDNGSARWGWQTGAWSGGNREPRAHIFQRIGFAHVDGVECDVNEACAEDIGQHPRTATLFGLGLGQHVIEEEESMASLPATPAPADFNSDPATWPQTNFDVTVIEGDQIWFGVQDFGGRNKDRARGFLYLASWGTGDGSLIPIDTAYTSDGKGRPILAHWPTRKYRAPSGALIVTVNYAAPNGAYIGLSP